MGVLVDTSVFALIERRGLPLSSVRRLVSPDERLSLSALTLSELTAGVVLGGSGQREGRREFIDTIVTELPVVDFDSFVARRYGELWAAMRLAGNFIGRHDLMIGATALAYDFAILTYNTRDFTRIPGLEVRVPESL